MPIPYVAAGESPPPPLLCFLPLDAKLVVPELVEDVSLVPEALAVEEPDVCVLGALAVCVGPGVDKYVSRGDFVRVAASADGPGAFLR